MATQMPASGEFDAQSWEEFNAADAAEEEVPAWANTPAREPAQEPAAPDTPPPGEDLAAARTKQMIDDEETKRQFDDGWGLSPDPVDEIEAPAEPATFGQAFAAARKAGKPTFSWKGKTYTTQTKASNPPKKVAPPAVEDAVSRRIGAEARAAERAGAEAAAQAGVAAGKKADRSPDRPAAVGNRGAMNQPAPAKPSLAPADKPGRVVQMDSTADAVKKPAFMGGSLK